MADRRLTMSDGRTVEDPETKLTYLWCPDAAVGIAFTGFAGSGGLTTATWLRKTLYEVDAVDPRLDTIVEHVRLRAAQTFNRFRTPLTFVFLGWSTIINDDGSRAPFLRSRIVTNQYERRLLPHFVVQALDNRVRAERGEFLVSTWGMTDGVRTEDFEQLAHMVRGGSPAAASVGKALGLMRRAAEDPRSMNLVGTDYMSVVLPSAEDTHPVFSFHPSGISKYSDSVNVVAITHSGPRLEGPGISTADIDVLPVARRRGPCPCGSGLRFKHCHGRTHHQSPFMVRMVTERAAFEFTDSIEDMDARPSSRRAWEVSLTVLVDISRRTN